jgi:hypothetical protein
MERKHVGSMAALGQHQALRSPVVLSFECAQGAAVARSEEVSDEQRLARTLMAEGSVMNAIADPVWDWRTIGGIQRSTGLDEEVIIGIVRANSAQLDIKVSSQYGLLVRPKGRTDHPVQRVLAFIDTVLDILSLGKRPIVRP